MGTMTSPDGAEHNGGRSCYATSARGHQDGASRSTSQPGPSSRATTRLMEQGFEPIASFSRNTTRTPPHHHITTTTSSSQRPLNAAARPPTPRRRGHARPSSRTAEWTHPQESRSHTEGCHSSTIESQARMQGQLFSTESRTSSETILIRQLKVIRLPLSR